MQIKQKQSRIFWISFGVSVLCILFLTAFFYLSTKEDLGIQEVALSIKLPMHNEEESFSITFLGEKKEISSRQIKEMWSVILERYPFVQRMFFLIPAKYRAAFGIGSLFWENIKQRFL